MPKGKEQKKEPIEMTTEEAITELFPPKVVEKLKDLVRCDEQEPEELEAN
jgi:hypothetical protein